MSEDIRTAPVPGSARPRQSRDIAAASTERAIGDAGGEFPNQATITR